MIFVNTYSSKFLIFDAFLELLSALAERLCCLVLNLLDGGQALFCSALILCAVLCCVGVMSVGSGAQSILGLAAV